MNEKPAISMTFTGEVFLPIRVFYQIHDMHALLLAFGKLSCMSFDKTTNRWVWLYDNEAKSLKFNKSYAEIPKEQRPIVLGSFYSNGSNEMHLDVRSVDRVATAIVFFDKYIRRKVAEVLYCAVYNKILEQAELPGPNFDKLFAEVNTGEIEAKQEYEVKKMVAMMKSGQLIDAFQDNSFDLVEAFPVHFYEDGIDSFKSALQMRQTVAIKRWQGDKDFTLGKLISSMFLK
ncbi:MAG: hypothetical protein JZU60_04230 [Ilumatobacteraceae bacterium]|jgi:hypothetical protein|nr:hypothetical protein [Ilumatobacteraceae bacterium]